MQSIYSNEQVCGLFVILIKTQYSELLYLYREKAEFNQYWYSPDTIERMVNAIQSCSKRVAFLSTPSIYFSLTDPALKEASVLFDVRIRMRIKQE